MTNQLAIYVDIIQDSRAKLIRRSTCVLSFIEDYLNPGHNVTRQNRWKSAR